MDDHDLVEDGRIVKRRARGGEKGMEMCCSYQLNVETKRDKTI